MIRIGMVGSDNSHALEFSKLLNVHRMYGDDVQVVAICGDEPERTTEVAREGQIPTIVTDGTAMLGMIDAAMVVHRHGGLHATNALPLIEAGLPLFVDKPLAISLDDAHTILDAAERHHTLVTSFSALRWGPDTEAFADEAASIGALRVGVFSGPCDWESQYGGPLFYSTHTIEIMLRLCGEDVQMVRAVRHNGNVVATLTLGDGALVTLNLMGNAAYVFHALVFGSEGYKAGSIGVAGAFHEDVRRFIDMIRTGVAPLRRDQLLRPLWITYAIERSLSTDGTAVPVESVDSRGSR